MSDVNPASDNSPTKVFPAAQSPRTSPLRSRISISLLIVLGGGLAWHFWGKPYLEQRSIDALTAAGMTVVDQGFAILVTDYSLKTATDETLKMLRGINRDLSVDLVRGEKITNAGLSELAKCPNLRWLKIGGTQINDEGIAALGRLKRIETLDLSRLPITDKGVETLASLDLPELTELNLAYTSITDAGILPLSKLKGLAAVSVNSTKVTEGGAAALKKQAPDLQVLGVPDPNEAPPAKGEGGRFQQKGERPAEEVPTEGAPAVEKPAE